MATKSNKSDKFELHGDAVEVTRRAEVPESTYLDYARRVKAGEITEQQARDELLLQELTVTDGKARR
jgi:hypothetical protein